MLSTEPGKAVDVPIRVDDLGALRVGETRVSLLSVLTAFEAGSTAEQIAYSFPALDLGQVYAVIAYYLANKSEVDEWVKRERAHGEVVESAIRASSSHAGIRERLLARRASAERGRS